MRFGTAGFCAPGQGAERAAADEAMGFDLCYFGENSLYASDPFGELRDAARATSRIGLAVGATNFVTRHPAVIANAVAGIHVASGGRAVCGIATGDSAVGVLGLRRQRIAEFAASARTLRALLRGDAPEPITWLHDSGLAPVAIEVMCSGPRAIGVAAEVGDRATLTVGASPERVRWAIDVLGRGLHAAGRTREEVAVGAFVAVALDDDREAAVERLRPRVSPLAHMAAFPDIDLDAQPERLRGVTRTLRDAYDYRHHNARPGNPLAALIEPEFADWFGIAGDPDHVARRLAALEELGVEYVFLAGMVGAERERFAAEVIPRMASLANEVCS